MNLACLMVSKLMCLFRSWNFFSELACCNFKLGQVLKIIENHFASEASRLKQMAIIMLLCIRWMEKKSRLVRMIALEKQ